MIYSVNKERPNSRGLEAMRLTITADTDEEAREVLEAYGFEVISVGFGIVTVKA